MLNSLSTKLITKAECVKKLSQLISRTGSEELTYFIFTSLTTTLSIISLTLNRLYYVYFTLIHPHITLSIH